MFVVIVIALVAVLGYILKWYSSSYWKELYWVWDDGSDGSRGPRRRIDTDNISFPPSFLWGISSSAYQIEGGCTTSNWSLWERAYPSRIRDQRPCGLAADHWNRYREDVGLMQSLGVNAYRMSLSWSRIEPTLGQFDTAAIQHYHDELDALRQAGITPMITLHHFAHPQWFESLGGFERRENIALFVRFCQRMFQEFGAKAHLWTTINEPFFYVMGGWIMGNFPPGKHDANLAGTVLRNVLEAHVEVYQVLKEQAASMGLSSVTQIGFIKEIYHFDPWNPIHPLDRLTANLLQRLFTGAILDWLTTGTFEFKYPGHASVSAHMPAAPRSFDFLGLNYYSHGMVNFRFSLSAPAEIRHLPGVIMSDGVNSPVYPEGLYRAIRVVSKLKVPIYITENGVADAQDDRRHLFLRRHIYALSKALSDGFDVRGYFYWSLTDTFEWHEGHALRFGLFAVDPVTRDRTLRDGSKYFSHVIRRFAPAAPTPLPPSLTASAGASSSSSSETKDASSSSSSSSSSSTLSSSPAAAAAGALPAIGEVDEEDVRSAATATTTTTSSDSVLQRRKPGGSSRGEHDSVEP